MKTNFEQILKEQIILEFHQRGLDSLIVFFMTKYPNFPYTELKYEQIHREYLEVYDIPFLASYIRYSDISLLGSGMRDKFVKEKLCYLHLHIGTILPSYKKFIWSTDITLEDLKRWLPLLSDSLLKNKIMGCTKINEDYKQFIDLCLDFSFPYQNLKLLDQLYPKNLIELDSLFRISNQETFYKLLKLVQESNISISYEKLLEMFLKTKSLLELVPMELLTQYHYIEEECLSSSPLMDTLKEFEKFCHPKRKEHEEFLENEFDVSTLKEFYCQLFLGTSYSMFSMFFPTLPNDSSEQYQLLLELYEARFPLMLKEELYQKFMNYKNLKSYFGKFLSHMKDIETLQSKQSLLSIDQNCSLITMQSSKFCFIASLIEDYQKSKDVVSSTIYSNNYFPYQKGCLVAYSNPTIVSHDKNTCDVQKRNLIPKFLLAFDVVSCQHLQYQKNMSIPIVVIETETYVKKLIQILEKLYAEQDWDSYMNQKRNLFFSILNHPWLFTKYFTLDNLYEDVKVLGERIEDEIKEKSSVTFIKMQVQILEKLISLNEELEFVFTNENRIKL